MTELQPTSLNFSTAGNALDDRRIDANAPSADIAFIKDGERWTHEQFAAKIDRLAAGFLVHGIGSGDRVALHLRNGPETAAA